MQATGRYDVPMRSAKNVVIAVLLVLVIVVVLQNTETVDTKLLFVTLSMPRALLLGLTLLVGVVAGLLLGTKLPRAQKKER